MNQCLHPPWPCLQQDMQAVARGSITSNFLLDSCRYSKRPFRTSNWLPITLMRCTTSSHATEISTKFTSTPCSGPESRPDTVPLN